MSRCKLCTADLDFQYHCSYYMNVSNNFATLLLLLVDALSKAHTGCSTQETRQLLLRSMFINLVQTKTKKQRFMFINLVQTKTKKQTTNNTIGLKAVSPDAALFGLLLPGE